MKNLIFLLLSAAAVLVSCIKTEPLNPEADILRFTPPDSASFIVATRISNRSSDNKITVMVLKDSKVDAIAPEIIISPGARIEPASGVTLNFETTQRYTVYPQNGVGSRTYDVNFISYFPFDYHFENWRTEGAIRKFDTPYEVVDGGEGREGVDFNIWDSGNSGIAIYMNAPYPTRKTTETTEVYSGLSAAKMVTMKGPGNVLGIMYIPVVAGSLFIGEFKLDMANPLRSPKFNLDCSELPVRFEGYYKYKEGTGDFIDAKGKPSPGQSDSCSIYSLMYEVTEDIPLLSGENVFVKTDNGDIVFPPNVVAYAWVPRTSGTEGNDFKRFDIPYVYPYGKGAIDFKNKKYKFTVILSSSFRGDYYEGKMGSTLIVDDIIVTTE